MPLDPSIILGIQPTQIENPLDAMAKAATYKNLASRGQIEGLQAQKAQQEMNDQTAMRNAYSNNTKINPDGTASVDSTGMMKDLASTAPHLIPQVQAEQAQRQMAVQENQMKTLQAHAAIAAQVLGETNDQNSYEKAQSHAQSLGYDTSSWPKEYDPNWVKNAQYQALTAKERIEAQQKDMENTIKQKQADNDSQRLAIELGKNKATQVQETLASLQSARGNPAVQKAENDVYSAAKINSLINQVKDPNNLTPVQVNLAAHEALKMATGGQGTEDQLKDLKPGTPEYKFAQIYQNIKNNPEPAKAGKFVKQLQDYANSIQDDAKDVIRTNYQGVIESKKPFLPAGSYKTLNDQFLGRLNGTTPPSEWASAPGNSPTSQKSGTTNTSSVKGPLVGTIVSGHKFLGGNPNDKNSWAPMTAGK